jgi:hypothetical protein
MPTGNIRWQSLIQTAPDETAVLGLVRRYLGTLSDGEVSRLPATCRPTLPSTREEIASWAVTVTRTEMGFRGDAETAGLLQQLAVVFAEASQRFAQLAQQRRDLD